MRRDTAAPQFLGSAISWLVSACAVWRLMLGDRLVDLVWSCLISADLGKSTRGGARILGRKIDSVEYYIGTWMFAPPTSQKSTCARVCLKRVPKTTASPSINLKKLQNSDRKSILNLQKIVKAAIRIDYELVRLCDPQHKMKNDINNN